MDDAAPVTIAWVNQSNAEDWSVPVDAGSWNVVDNPPFSFWLGDAWERDLFLNYPMMVVNMGQATL